MTRTGTGTGAGGSGGSPPRQRPEGPGSAGVDRLLARVAEAQRAGQLEEAERLLRAGLSRYSKNPDLLHAAGIVARARGQSGRALHLIERALTHDPGRAIAHHHRGLLLDQAGRTAEALAAFEAALEADRRLTNAAFALAALCERLGQPARALAAVERALFAPADCPTCPDGIWSAHPALVRAAGRLCNLRGTLLEALGQPGAAALAYEQALALAPMQLEVLVNLGTVRRLLRQPAAALRAFEQVIALAGEPAPAAEPHPAAGQGSAEASDEAVTGGTVSGTAVLIAAHNNRGNLLKELGRFGTAIAGFDHTLRLAPGFAEAATNRGKCRLAIGDLGGLADLDRRFEAGPLAAEARVLRWPLWQGEPLAGRRLLIWREQGLGDELMFAALYREVIAQAAAVTLVCDPRLVPLFRRSFPAAMVCPAGHAVDHLRADGCGLDYDFHTPAGSLARWLRPRLSGWPGPVSRDSFAAEGPGYLRPDPQRQGLWRQRLAALAPGLRVGLCWRSRNRAGDRAWSYTALESWEPVLTLPGLCLVNLQYDDCEAELRAAEARFGTPIARWPDLSLADDLEATAALIASLDLVLSAPTAVGELAAALGVPVWRTDRLGSWTLLGTGCRPWFPAQRPWIAGPEADLTRLPAAIARDLAAVSLCQATGNTGERNESSIARRSARP